MLPGKCRDDVAWATAELRERKLPQTEILEQLNARIAYKGCGPISKGAFSRYSARVARQLELGVQSGPTDADDVQGLVDQMRILRIELAASQKTVKRALRAIERIERALVAKEAARP